MNKLLILVLLSILSFLLNAEEIKQSKDTNKTMSNDEFMKRFMALEQREKDAKAKTMSIKKTGEVLDEINQLLGVDKKK